MRTTKRINKLLSLVLVFLFLFLNTGAMLSGATDLTDSEQEKIDSYKAQQEDLKNQISENKEKMDALKDDIAKQEEYVNTLQAQINAYQAQIDVLNENIAFLESQKDAIQVQIDELAAQIEEIHTQINHNELEQIALQQEIDDVFTELKDRLCDIYVYGKTSELELLLNSRDFQSFLITMELSSNIAAHDNEIITGLKEKIAQIDELNAEHIRLIEEIEAKQAEHQQQIDALSAKQDDIRDSRAVLESAQDEIEALESEASAYLRELDEQSAAYKALIAQYEASIKAFDAKIDSIIEEARKRNLPVSFTPSSGLICPLQYSGAYISSGYGYRTGTGTAYSNFHGGLDICVYGGTYGKNISAAANGTVLIAAHMGSGYGNYILLDHGNGLYTLYGHNSQLLVSTGDTVYQGQTIAYAGESGYAFGAHCHFEVRVNGSKVNPLNYISVP